MLQTFKRLMRRGGRAVAARARLVPANARALWVRSVSRKPFWYTDRYGLTLELQPEDNLPFHFSRRMLFDDPGVVALLQQLVRPGMTVLDVGAHTGAFTLLAARLLCGSGSVHAFEPTGATYRRLERNVHHSPQLASSVVLNRLAVASRDAELVLHTFPPGYSAWNTFGQPELVDERRRKRRPTGTEVVQAVTVDTYCDTRQVVQVDLLKIDVEGFEDDVIRGCARLIERRALPMVLFEISQAPLGGAGKTAQGILAAFRDQGFKLFLIEQTGGLVTVEDVARFEAPFFANYLAVHTGTPLPRAVSAGVGRALQV